MKTHDFIIAYDIADPKRLRKIAKILEKKALRIQYSIYILYDATEQEAINLVRSLDKIYNEKEDDIRIYKIKNYGLHFGSALDLNNPLIF